MDGIESKIVVEAGGMTMARHRVPAEFAAGDAFHVRGGHLVDVLANAKLIELTRSEEYRRKAEHLARAADFPRHG